jgi:hypothetical protein
MACNRRSALRSDGSDNLSATVAADRVFPAAVAELTSFGDLAKAPQNLNCSLSSIRWLRVLSAALAVIALSFIILAVIVVVYAFVLAFQARGAPDQSAINHFAARVSPKLMPWLEAFLTFFAALIVARRAEKGRATHGLYIGILAGLLSLTVPLAFAGRLGLRNLVLFLIIVALGWLGGFVGQKRAAGT